MDTNSGTRTRMAAAVSMGLIVLGFAAIGLAGPRRFARICLSAWTGAVAEWRGDSGNREASIELKARMDAMSRELDRLRQETARTGPSTPSPASMQAEISGLKAQVTRIEQLVDRHERGMRVVRETLDQMAQRRQATLDTRK